MCLAPALAHVSHHCCAPFGSLILSGLDKEPKYKTGSQQALSQCSCTYGDLLLIQVCSVATQMHCSTGQGNMHSPLFSAALQNRLAAGTVTMQLHLWRFALDTGVQCCNTNALQHWSGQNAFPLFNAALQKRHTACSVSLQLHLWR